MNPIEKILYKLGICIKCYRKLDSKLVICKKCYFKEYYPSLNVKDIMLELKVIFIKQNIKYATYETKYHSGVLMWANEIDIPKVKKLMNDLGVKPRYYLTRGMYKGEIYEYQLDIRINPEQVYKLHTRGFYENK